MKQVRLIERTLPVKELSQEGAREKAIRHGTSPPCMCGGPAGSWRTLQRAEEAR